jgi:hypothetical protein
LNNELISKAIVNSVEPGLLSTGEKCPILAEAITPKTLVILPPTF